MRVLPVVLADAVIVKLPLPLPEDGDTVSQLVALEDTVQETFDVTDTLWLPPVGGGDQEVGLTVRTGSGADWVTLTDVSLPLAA